MCGLTGFFTTAHPLNSSQMDNQVQLMARTLNHRGPDAEGVWTSPDTGIALGHSRLSIIDLSSQGHQPMLSACGRYVIAFNGEIYNYPEICKELELMESAPAWKGHSDTEIMLAAISHWGLESALNKFIGMFAFALWDREERVLKLVRDRLGEKPLYYGWMNKVFMFGSELRALKAHAKWQGDIDRNSLGLLMRYNCIPAPYSIYKNIFKLLPGTIVTINTELLESNALSSSPLVPKYYWSSTATAPEGHVFSLREEKDAVNSLEKLLSASIKRQMIADVPLGAFLSGGVDSSTIVALMQNQSSSPTQTFTIGFDENNFNEAPYAKAVAKHLGTDHTELYVSPDEAMKVIPKMATIYDEPFSDSSQIPTFLVSQLARKHVTVCLSGDGADELFGGYNRYFWGERVWSMIHRIPKPLRAALQCGITAVPPDSWDRLFHTFDAFIPKNFKQVQPGDKLHKLAEYLPSKHPHELYSKMVSHWSASTGMVLGTNLPDTANIKNSLNSENFTQMMMHLDMARYLPDDILVKVDRASMAVGLEARVPFLDHRVVEFALNLPLNLKIRNGQGKWLLRQVLYKYVPKELIERPKMGFGVPIDVWLRGPLKNWAESLLSEDKLKREGFFNSEPIRKKWQEHLSGKKNWQYHLWDVLMFQDWLSTHKTP